MACLYDRMCFGHCIKYFSIAIILEIIPLHGFHANQFQQPSEILCKCLINQNGNDFLRELKALEFEISLSENQVQRTAQFYGEFLKSLSQKTGKEITIGMVLKELRDVKELHGISDAAYFKLEKFLQYVAEVMENPYQKPWNSYVPDLGLGGGSGGHEKSNFGENLFSILEIGLGTAIGITFSWTGIGGVIGGTLVGHGICQLADKAHEQWQSSIYNAPSGANFNKPYEDLPND